ncbi:ATP-binding protein [Paenibacillus cremeus]|uniref:ATP-binding protein n=1 Tax=Paenibacillus cremeus TaxID=2163881 RepID=UPI0021BD8237|nr:ATP-binding protein [Paenibacillus cremeus]
METPLLLNVLLIITPVLLFQVFSLDRLQRYNESANRWITTGLCAALSVFAMSHPVELIPGFQYDLRVIPLVICFFYAGMNYALVVAAMIFAYRIFLGGFGVYWQPVTIGFILLLLWYCKKRTAAHPERLYSIRIAALIGFGNAFIVAVVTLASQLLNGKPITSNFYLFFGIYFMFHTFTMTIVALIVRQMKQNVDLRKQLQHNEKMNVLSELAASFAHEIRNPMTVARGFVQIMKQGGLSEDKRQIYNQMVIDEMDKAQSIIDDYLSFAKPQLESIDLVDAKQLILRALNTLQEFADLRHVSVETDMQDRLMISANADKFVQCIINLCKNGIEAMPSGGKLQIVASLQNQTVCIDIIDNGVGMTQEELGRLGTPFYSTRGKGTGLGMMVTYRVIQNIHGRIDVTSEIGKGTCFSILIPSLHTTSYH